MKPVASETLHFTKEQVETIRALLASNDNRISAVWWQVETWWPTSSVESRLSWIEDARDNAYNFELGTYRGQKHSLTTREI